MSCLLSEKRRPRPDEVTNSRIPRAYAVHEGSSNQLAHADVCRLKGTLKEIEAALDELSVSSLTRVNDERGDAPKQHMR